MCALEVIVGRDGREAIIEVNDCALSLMGDSQEEDRRLIADLVCQKMQVHNYSFKQKENIILTCNCIIFATQNSK